MIRKLMFACAWLFALTAMAIPAKRAKRTITLADGTQKVVVLSGDEHVHFYTDAEGNAYQKNEDGTFYMVDKSELISKWQERLSKRNSSRVRRAAARRTTAATINPISGSKKGLVILANFSDKAMASTHSKAFFNNYFNQEGFSQNGMAGSVHDYFKECSYGKFDLTFDVVGPVTVSKSVKYYGENDSNGDDKHSGEFVTEVVNLADKQGVDFSKYDWDGDGNVDQVYIVYAGYSESEDAASYTLWPHESELDLLKEYNDGNGAIKVDGVTVNTYAVSSECSGTSGSTISGIGAACHEFSHCMNLPDMYDTEGNSFGMGDWDLMCSGSYNGSSGDNNGTCPSGYSSYERMYCGWLTPTELSSPTTVSSLPSLANNAQAYIIYNQGNKNEFYMLENRQKEGFFAGCPAFGMLILHVDYDKTAWEDNVVNNTASRQRMTIFPADGKSTIDDQAGDTWPGSSNKTSFTDSSTPAATLYNANSNGKKYMGKPITKIALKNGIISFDFDGGSTTPTPAAPVAKDASNVGSAGFTASWNAVTGATQYELELTATDIVNGGDNTGDNTGGNTDDTTSSIPAASILLKEDFSGFKNATTSDGTQDISQTLDKYTAKSGWEGEYLYTTPRNEVKMGSTRSSGCLYTPNMSSKKGIVTLIVEGYSSSTSGTTFNLYYANGSKDAEYNSSLSFNQTSAIKTKTMKATSDFWLGLEAESRFYLSQFVVLDGDGYTNDQVKTLFKAPKIAEATIEATQTTTYKTTATSYTFTNLSSDKTYTYRVRALAGSVVGAWSNSIKVDLPVGIHSVISDDTTAPTTNKIYDLQGREVKEITSHGIYIINGRKVLK